MSTVTLGFHSSWGGGGGLLVSLGREETMSEGGCSEIGDTWVKAKGPLWQAPSLTESAASFHSALWSCRSQEGA